MPDANNILPCAADFVNKKNRNIFEKI